MPLSARTTRWKKSSYSRASAVSCPGGLGEPPEPVPAAMSAWVKPTSALPATTSATFSADAGVTSTDGCTFGRRWRMRSAIAVPYA
jgi:hypothetical protein